MSVKYGDTIRARAGTIAATFAEGRTGKVASINQWGTRGLVRWGGEEILLGFRPEEVEVVDA